MTKVNDYYYQIEGGKGRWYSWREICELRRWKEVVITAKITKVDYHRKGE
jgi:hypothetical protein